MSSQSMMTSISCFQRMREGGQDVEDIIKKYLSKEEAEGLQNWDREEQKAITTYVRTKSGRRVEKVGERLNFLSYSFVMCFRYVILN